MSPPAKIPLLGAETPKAILDLNYAFATTYMLVAAVRLRLFTIIARGARTAEDIATAAEATPHGVHRLLDGLWTLGLVERTGPEYGLSPAATRFLVEGSSDYLGEDTLAMVDIMDGWTRLTEVVRGGERGRKFDDPALAEAYYRGKVRGLFPLTYPMAGKLARTLHDRAGALPQRVLDVGAGAGAWSIALAELDSKVTVTANDLPDVLAVTKEVVAERGLSERYQFLPGDFEQLELGESAYDLVLVCHVCRFIGERRARQLLARLARSLAPGGQLVLADVVCDDARTGPPFGLVISLSMLVNTAEGDIFTMGQFRSWLTDAGFSDIETLSLGGPTPVLVARR